MGINKFGIHDIVKLSHLGMTATVNSGLTKDGCYYITLHGKIMGKYRTVKMKEDDLILIRSADGKNLAERFGQIR